MTMRDSAASPVTVRRDTRAQDHRSVHFNVHRDSQCDFGNVRQRKFRVFTLISVSISVSVRKAGW